MRARSHLARSHLEGAKEMDKYGITCASVDDFHLGQYRYTYFEEMIAEAKRQLAKG